VSQKKSSDAGSALAYASKMLEKSQSSGSAAAYAEGLNRAAKTFKSKQVTPENAFGLVQSLLGGQSSSPAGGDVLGSLLSGLGGGQQADEGLDMGDLLSAGMAFLQAQQQGGGTIESLIQAVISSGALGGSAHRAQSGQLVGSTLMKVVGALTGK
jgi:hypothetical protein